MQRRLLSVLWQRSSSILEGILPIFSRRVSVGLPGQSQGIFNQHSEAIPSAVDKGANGLGWNEDICLISLMSKCSTPQSLARSVPAHTKNCFWDGSLLQCSSPAHAWAPGHSRNPAYLDLQQVKASKSHAASSLSASWDQQGLSEVNKWPVSQRLCPSLLCYLPSVFQNVPDQEQ